MKSKISAIFSNIIDRVSLLEEKTLKNLESNIKLVNRFSLEKQFYNFIQS
jgi:hypothetical protein